MQPTTTEEAYWKIPDEEDRQDTVVGAESDDGSFLTDNPNITVLFGSSTERTSNMSDLCQLWNRALPWQQMTLDLDWGSDKEARVSDAE